MNYRVCEIFYSLQGEGAQSGKPALFCRFAGCNLDCTFCDTDWKSLERAGGGEYHSTESLVKSIKERIPESISGVLPMMLFTGGEPALQIQQELIDAVHREGFEIAVETNGTALLPGGIDWICVSPKSRQDLIVRKGNEIKVLYPLEDLDPGQFEHLDFTHFFIQPLDGPEREQNTRKAVEYCLTHPRWRLSLQLHKILGIA